jgi:hypothetical protein
MIEVRFPEPRFRLKEEDGKHFIFDSIRKSWLRLTDEEWVRQNFVAWLTDCLDYPTTLIAVEKEIILNGLKKRFDIMVYDQQHQPWMIVECKSHEVPLTESVLEQALRYNMSVPVKYLVITNGKATRAWRKENQLIELDVMPGFREP